MTGRIFRLPVSLLKKRYGDAVRGEVLEQTVNTSSQRMVSEKGIRPAGQPNCDIGAFESDFDPPVLDLTPDLGLDFGMIETGMMSGAMVATLTNTGGSDATNIVTMFTGEFSAMTDNCNATTLMPGGNRFRLSMVLRMVSTMFTHQVSS